MDNPDRYPKRLIEVDLPIRRISVHARREKSVGPLSTLHMWWARRPLAACRAVLCATLWPDPADESCPEAFRESARREMLAFAKRHLGLLSADSYNLFLAFSKTPDRLNDGAELRKALLEFIAEFADWSNATNEAFLRTSQTLTLASHESLGGTPGTRPLVVDPFAGGGSIPLEALRIGADSFASDLNPIPVLLNRVVLEYIPKFGNALSTEVRRCADWIKREASRDLASVYPAAEGGATPIAFLWARTIRCEGPSCGADVPVVRGPWLSKGTLDCLDIQADPDAAPPRVRIDVKQRRPPSGKDPKGTVRRGAVTCPVCGYTIQRNRVEQLANQGAMGERLTAVVSTRPGTTGRAFRASKTADVAHFQEATSALARLPNDLFSPFSTIPDEDLPYLRSIFNVHVYGVRKWSQLFNDRQLLAAITFARLVRECRGRGPLAAQDTQFADAVATLLSLATDRLINALNRTCYWNPTGQKMQAGFARQALPMFWDYCEANPFGGSVGSWDSMVECVTSVFEKVGTPPGCGSSVQCSATAHVLPDDIADSVVTDPPYYDAIPYADLSDFFYVWLKRMLGEVHPALFETELSPKKLEVVQLAERNPKYSYKTKENFEALMTEALAEARRVAKPSSTSVVVFAHQSTSGWESMLSALIRAGWIVTASWPIDTEMPTRVRARDSAVLASSIHLACRPRADAEGSAMANHVGDWRAVLNALPLRIHEWMPRLAKEGVVGADAIFACLGPALEIFSRYSRVERATGEVVTLREYLEQVWAAVSREALSMIFDDPETAGLDEDARLTAMWLWTIAAPDADVPTEGLDDDEATDEDQDDTKPKGGKGAGFSLEFDAARKIAQGLGAKLEDLTHVVEVKGDKARLLAVAERAKHLFGGGDDAPAARKAAKKRPQRALFEELEEVAEQQGWGEVGTPKVGSTTLDRVHQAMILFGAGRGEAIKRFLVEEGAGRSPQFWKLAQALSALYPTGTDEKRWVDGVLARKKGLGF